MRPLLRTARPLRRAAMACIRMRLSSTGALWTKLNELGTRPGAINMGQGFPDFAGSAVARRAAQEALDVPALNQYAPINGLPELRDEIRSFYQRRYGASYDDDEVVVTTSGQEALVASLKACFTEERRGVVVLEPFYPFLAPAIAAAGGVMQPARLGDGFVLDAEALDAAADATTACAVLNTPHNPTGRVFTAAEIDAFASFCERANGGIYAVADEVYEHAVFPGAMHRRLADRMPDRTISLSSAGKLFSLTGWRVGWALGPRDLALKVSNAHMALTYSAPTPLQKGIAEALKAEDGSFDGVPFIFHRNAEMLTAALTARGLDVFPPAGGYFLVANCHEPAMGFVEKLADETGVVCTPLSVFYSTPPLESGDTWVRFTICKSASQVEKACEALAPGPAWLNE
jgi:N-succinyldiaminopimelate aminotransferase